MRSAAMLWVLLVTGCSAAQGSPSVESAQAGSPTEDGSAAGMSVRALGTMDGAPMGYLEYLPPDYEDGEPRPLLVFLHGSGEAGNGSEAALDLVDKLGVPELIEAGEWPDDRPFIVLAPQYGTGPANDDCAIGEDIAGFLDFATGHYEIDPARVYLTGISCGAIGMWDYFAAHGGEVIAAAVPISGHAVWALEESGCAPLAEVPVWAFHGALDNIVPTVHVQGPFDEIRACEGADAVELELTLYPNADHDAWTRTYDLSAGHDIYAWMLEHTND